MQQVEIPENPRNVSVNDSYLNYLAFRVRFPSVRVNEPFFKVHIRHTVTDTTWFVSGCSDRRFHNDKTDRQYVKNDVCVFVCDIDLDNCQPPLLTQIDSYLLHIEAGLL